MSLRRVRVIHGTQKMKKYRFGYVFIMPAMALYLIFIVYPLFSSFYLSLTSWDGATKIKQFVGLENYLNMLRDPLFWLSLQHNLLWLVIVTCGSILIGLFLAMLIRKRPFGFIFFRTVFFLPQILGVSVLGVIWRLIFQPRRGILYELGVMFNIEWLKFGPLADVKIAIYAVMFVCIWASIGFYFVIFLASLQSLDKEIIEAAQIDGANTIQCTVYVIIPQLSHVITMITILAMIAALKLFDLVWVMTRGGPASSTELIATYAYRNFSSISKVGYSSALTMIMALLALIITIVFILMRERKEVL